MPPEGRDDLALPVLVRGSDLHVIQWVGSGTEHLKHDLSLRRAEHVTRRLAEQLLRVPALLEKPFFK
jgi:hypothetical protein